jgi:DNA adenine methylase
VEVFAGAAWVLLGKPVESSKSEVLNDRDGELVNFWRVLKHRPAEFAEQASMILASRELWNEWAAPLRSPEIESKDLDEIERAVRMYLVIKCGFSAQRVPTAFAGHAARRPAMRWIDLREEVGALFTRLRQVWIEHLDWRECLAKYDSAHTFFYADPPYRCPGSKAYLHKFGDADHEALAKALLGLKGKWLLSYNDDPWISALYARQGIKIERRGITYTIAATSPLEGRELLVRNYDLPPGHRQKLAA